MRVWGLDDTASARRVAARVKAWAVAHPVLFIFLTALVVRITLAVVLTTTVGMDFFPDTKTYDRLASELASGASHHWSDRDALYYERLGGYILPVSLLYRIFGTHLFLGQLLAALLGAAAAAAICKLVLLVGDRRVALVAGSIVAVFPSPVVWSSVAYKDSSVWAASSAAALLVALGVRARGWRLASIGAGLVALVFILGHLRLVTLMAVCGSLVVAAFLSEHRGRVARVSGALAIAILMPWYLGLGPAGVKLLQPFGGIRAHLACTATSAFTKCESLTDSSVGADIKHLPRGLSATLIEPFPWASLGGFDVRMAQAELLLWGPLFAVAACGIPAAYRRRRELAFLILTAGAVLMVFALGEGNYGTAYRHRSELVPALAVLAAFGAPRISRWWRARRRAIDRDRRDAGHLPT